MLRRLSIRKLPIRRLSIRMFSIRMFSIAAIIFVAIIFAAMLNVNRASAMNVEERNLICAMASLSAYSSDVSTMVRNELAVDGWTVEPIEAYASKADAKALLLRRTASTGRINILSICGTEDQKDAEIDLRLKLTPFDVEGGAVHTGFNDYAEVLLGNERVQAVLDEITSAGEKLYLTGHSLGGAVAILTAARLTERGLGDSIEVITFGAPAVGDRYFAAYFDGRIKLTRITVSGDPIKKSLRSLGYMHFGDALKYSPAKSVAHFRHKMAVYLDCALRNYYDAHAGDDRVDELTGDGKIYVAPLRIVVGSFDRADEKYIGRIVRDVLMSRSANYMFDPTLTVMIDRKKYEDDFTDVEQEEFRAARAAGCDRVLIQLLRSKQERELRGDVELVTLEQIVCDLNGFPLSMQTSSMNTNEVTALEAVMFAQWRSSL